MTYFKIEGFSKYLLGKGDGENEWSVWRIKKSGKLKKVEGCLDRSGHIQYSIHSDGKHVTKYLHVLIAEQFITIPKELLESGEPLHVHHRDHNPQNNTISNLVWLTRSEHRRLHMEGKPRPQGSGKAEKQVHQYDLDNNLIAVWPSTAECGRNGFHQGSISNCCLGKTKTYKGYRWSYTPL